MTEEQLEEGMTPELIEPNQFVAIVENSGLEQNKAQFLLEQFQDHYKMAAEWAKKAKNIIVTNESQTVNMKMARTGRLFLREKRLEIENARKSLKEAALKEGKAIDMIANFLKDLIIPTEEHLRRQEYFVELKKEAEDARILAEAHAKMEEERIAKEKADAEEMARLKKAEQEAALVLAAERRKAEEIAKAEKIRMNDLIAGKRMEREKAENELRLKRQAEEKQKADEIRRIEQEKSAGDVEKLIKLSNDIKAIKTPEVKSQESKEVIYKVVSYLNLAVIAINGVVKIEEEI